MFKRENQRQSTLADKFCDTYFIDDFGVSYIRLDGVRADSQYARNPELMLMPNARNQCIVEHDGMKCYRVRVKYHNKMRSNGNNAEGIFYYLNQIFTEDAIKELFHEPNIWLLKTNARAKRIRTTEQQEYNRRKKMYGADWGLHRECMKRTGNLSASRSARMERALQFG